MHLFPSGRRTPFLASLVALAAVAARARGLVDAAAPASPVPVFADLGRYHRPVTTSSREAQAYCGQGLRRVSAFNLEEAQRALDEPSVEQQGSSSAAAKTQQELDAWRHADVTLGGSSGTMPARSPARQRCGSRLATGSIARPRPGAPVAEKSMLAAADA